MYLCVASMGKPEDYDTMVQLYRAADLPEEKQRLVRYRYLTYTIELTFTRNNTVLLNLMLRRHGAKLLF